METAQSVLQSLRPGDWMVSLDLQDAYLQVPVHPNLRRYLWFCIGPHTFQFQALCFGLSSPPQVFTHVMAPISSIMHRHGYRILHYLDDWLVLGSSLEEILWARDFFLSLCEELGVLVSLTKSSLTPTQTIDYLGMSLQSTPLRASLTQARIQKVLSLVTEFSSSRTQPLSLWRSLLGVMVSLTPLIPCARLRMRSLQLHLNVAGPQCAEHALITWDDSCHRNLLWWSDASHLVGGGDVSRSSSATPLSFHGRGRLRLGCFSRDDQLSGLWTQDISGFSINHHELLVILYAVQGFLHLLRGRSVSLFTDNTSALAYLRKEGATRSSTPNSMAQSILCLCESQGARLLPQFVPGEAQRLGGLAQSQFPSLGLGVDPLPGCLPGSLPPLTGQHRPLRHLHESLAPGVLLPGVGSPGPSHGRHEPELGRPPRLCLPSVRLHFQCPRQGSPISEPGGHVGRSVLADEAVVPRHPGTTCRCSGPSSPPQGPSPPASFPPFSSEPPALCMTGYRIASEQRTISASLWEWRASLPTAAGHLPV